MESILYRIGLSILIIAVGVVAYVAWSRWQVFRLRRAAVDGAPGLETLRPGVPAVLYFTTTECAVCRTQQKPALNAVAAALGGGVQVIEINATERPAVADHWGVLSVPTTFIIDPSGQPRGCNPGLAGREKLLAQLAELLPPAKVGETARHVAAK